MQRKANSFGQPFRKHARTWTFLKPGDRNVTLMNISRQRSAKQRLVYGNKFPPSVVLSDRPGPGIKKWRRLLPWWFWQSFNKFATEIVPEKLPTRLYRPHAYLLVPLRDVHALHKEP